MEAAGEPKPYPDLLCRTVAAKSLGNDATSGVANKAAMLYVSNMQMLSPAEGQRALRTRSAILQAFVELVLERRYEAIRIPDLVAAAGVGRATFYEHFRGKNDVLLAAMEPVLLTLSTAASGRAARPYVKSMVGHLWERRSTGRTILNSAAAPVIQRHLAAMICPHVERADTGAAAPSIRSTGIAAAQIAMLRSWLTGEVSCSVDEMTDRMIDCSRLIV